MAGTKKDGPKTTSQVGVDLIKSFEGLKLEAYKCPAGVVTIGYGHTKTARMGQKITEKTAEKLLRSDLGVFERAINREVEVFLTQGQFDALVSFSFNVGVGAFLRSTLLSVLNEGLYTRASTEFLRWNKAGGKVLRGLTRRRLAEQQLFLKG